MSKHRAPEKERLVVGVWSMPSDHGRVQLLRYTNDEWDVRVFGHWIEVDPECAASIRKLTYRANHGGGVDYGTDNRPTELEWKAKVFG